MAELLLVLVPLLLLAGFTLLANSVAPLALGWVALGMMGVGLLVGVPSGLAYHVLLRRALLRCGPLPRGWYWAPQKHHAALDAGGVRKLRPWFLVGALGFLVIVLGFALALAALLLWFRAERAVLA